MSGEGSDRALLVFRFLSGAALGVGAGLLAVALPTAGLPLLVVVAAWSARVSPRFAQLAGVLIASGMLWFVVMLQGSFYCAANPSSCSGPPPEPFAIAGAVVAGAGVVALGATRRRLERAHDIGER